MTTTRHHRVTPLVVAGSPSDDMTSTQEQQPGTMTFTMWHFLELIVSNHILSLNVYLYMYIQL